MRDGRGSACVRDAGAPAGPLILAREHPHDFLTYYFLALEGAASGVPVLASSTGGLREVVVHEETGYLMQDRDPARWGRCLSSARSAMSAASVLSVGKANRSVSSSSRIITLAAIAR